MVPGLIAVVLIMPALALALAFAREKELGSFEGLAATPIRGVEYIFGKLLTYLGFGMLSMIPIVIAALAWFRVPLRGTLIDLAVVTLLLFHRHLWSGLARRQLRQEPAGRHAVHDPGVLHSQFLFDGPDPAGRYQLAGDGASSADCCPLRTMCCCRAASF